MVLEIMKSKQRDQHQRNVGPVLAEFVHIYCHLSDIEKFERAYEYFEWVSECELSRVKLALMCGEEYLEDRFVDVDDDAPFETVNRLISEEYPRLVKLVEGMFGGPDQLMESLEKCRYGDDDSPTLTPEDVAALGCGTTMSLDTWNLIQWHQQGWPRHGVEGCEV